MRTTILCLALCLAPPTFAAPRDVTVTLKNDDGKPLPSKTAFYVVDEKGSVVSATATAGAATIRLPEGRFSLWLMGNEKLRVPGKLWHGLEIAADTAKWDLTVPPFAAIQGRILRADGKPATRCAIQVQSGTNVSTPAFYWPSYPAQWAQLAAGAQNAYAATSTGPDGTFTLAGVVPGDYALDVFDGDSRKWFTIPFAPALKFDAANHVPTKIGTWTVPQNAWDWLLDAKLKRESGPAKFDGQGDMKTESRVLHLGIGKDLTGVTWSDATLPRENYEITLDARRVDGGDFFCGLTFPVGEKPLSWIVGGWGGTVVGLSNINGYSADENESTQTRDFDLNRWYRLRLRVSKAKIEAWINDDKVIDFPTKDKEFSIRYSVEPCKPLGIATWRTAGEVRDVRIRRLDAAEVVAIEKTVDQP